MSAEGINSLTSLIINELYASPTETGNFVFSVFGLYILLGIINLGQKGRNFNQLSKCLGKDFRTYFDRDNWRYLDSIYKFIHLYDLLEKNMQAKTAMFHSCALHQQYQEILQKFDIQKIKVNFSDSTDLAIKMEGWIYRDTLEEITNTYGETTQSDNTIVFLSEIIFPALTNQEIFVDEKGRRFIVQMMNEQSYNNIYDSPEQNFRIHFKFLKNIAIYSAVVLPKQGYTIADVLRSFKFGKIGTYFQQSKWKYVHLKLPKFKIFSQNYLIKALKNIGVTDIFERNNSNFGWMTNDTVYIGNLIQRANIEIDDVDVSVEAIETKAIEPLPQPEEFHVTRPFLFLVYWLYEEFVLISAVVTNPNDAQNL
ncbi:Glia-derived nexin [Thelohanellus kitauei]|uniref:Glia-derived nexin n=1 Tax=Thelohanellus kitauei TaxID=669202 RepID=A0A0C2MBX3_THEKT|nr:Glia-derived nexin [Thelohanellus kitauei]